MLEYALRLSEGESVDGGFNDQAACVRDRKGKGVGRGPRLGARRGVEWCRLRYFLGLPAFPPNRKKRKLCLFRLRYARGGTRTRWLCLTARDPGQTPLYGVPSLAGIYWVFVVHDPLRQLRVPHNRVVSRADGSFRSGRGDPPHPSLFATSISTSLVQSSEEKVVSSQEQDAAKQCQ